MFKRLASAVNSVKVIDKQFNDLSKTSNQLKIDKLLTEIRDKPEINGLVVKFLKDLNSLGISQKGDRESAKYKYYMQILKFRQLHSVIWDLCAVNDISQHSHKLKWNVNDLGLLDPKNFPSSYYRQEILEEKESHKVK